MTFKTWFQRLLLSSPTSLILIYVSPSAFYHTKKCRPFSWTAPYLFHHFIRFLPYVSSEWAWYRIVVPLNQAEADLVKLPELFDRFNPFNDDFFLPIICNLFDHSKDDHR